MNHINQNLHAKLKMVQQAPSAFAGQFQTLNDVIQQGVDLLCLTKTPNSDKRLGFKSKEAPATGYDLQQVQTFARLTAQFLNYGKGHFNPTSDKTEDCNSLNFNRSLLDPVFKTIAKQIDSWFAFSKQDKNKGPHAYPPFDQVFKQSRCVQYLFLKNYIDVVEGAEAIYTLEQKQYFLDLTATSHVNKETFSALDIIAFNKAYLLKQYCIEDGKRNVALKPFVSPPSPQVIANDSTYSSLALLKLKAMQSHNIHFIHGLSEFIYSKINPETLEFFKIHGGLSANDGTFAPHVTRISDFMIDTKSELAWSRCGFIRLAQNINTKEFVALKPLNSQNGNLPEEVDWLKKLDTYKGYIDATGTIFEQEALSVLSKEQLSLGKDGALRWVAMELMDGVTFSNLNLLLTKINHHARYLIAYNVVKAFEELARKHLHHGDYNAGNFIVSAKNFDFKVIDVADMKVFTQENFPLFFNKSMTLWDFSSFNQYNLLGRIFADKASISGDAGEAIKKYQVGTFKTFLERAEGFERNRLVFNFKLKDFIAVLPFKN